MKSVVVVFVVSAVGLSCRTAPPALEVTRVPEAGLGGPVVTRTIAGRVSGAEPGQRIVLFARSGEWYVQPFAANPFTSIQPDSTWQGSTHIGSDYAALLVDANYAPPRTTKALPGIGQGVRAVAVVPGRAETPVVKRLRFSGYEWNLTGVPGDRGCVDVKADQKHVWIDEEEALHLRLEPVHGGWNCGRIGLTRSLGYGTYAMIVRQHHSFEPASVLSFSTVDDDEPDLDRREMDIELTQWGDPTNKNAQFVIQPYYVPANVFRFQAPEGDQKHMFRWEAGRVSFASARMQNGASSQPIVEHRFTSGVPSPGNERVYISLYPYPLARTPQLNGTEVVIERFEYLP